MANVKPADGADSPYEVPDPIITVSLTLPLSWTIRARDLAGKERTTVSKVIRAALGRGLGIK